MNKSQDGHDRHIAGLSRASDRKIPYAAPKISSIKIRFATRSTQPYQADGELYQGSEIHPQANPEFVGSFQIAPIHPER